VAWLWILEVERVLGHRVLRYVEEEIAAIVRVVVVLDSVTMLIKAG
jgi:hypothetical protein